MSLLYSLRAVYLHDSHNSAYYLRIEILSYVLQVLIDNHGSGYLGMAGCSSVQGKKCSKVAHFQPTLSWFQTVSGSNQLYQPVLQSSLSQNIKLQLRKPSMYTTASI